MKLFKLFLAWQDEKEETWLREMAKKGWLLEKYSFPFYTFKKIKPKDYIYKLDFKTTFDNDLDEYKTLFKDFGWEHVTQCVKWHYFRTEADKCKLPDIYSDKNSKLQRHKVLFRILNIVLIFISFLAITVVFNNRYDYIAMDILKIIYAVMIPLFVYINIKVYIKIKKLKKNI
ncbi:MAG: DUF2812 domain-containing protein [Firmicutes bacterium]|nr:DUF2812 domain-containing protein [Bacillota bacterium]